MRPLKNQLCTMCHSRESPLRLGRALGQLAGAPLAAASGMTPTAQIHDSIWEPAPAKAGVDSASSAERHKSLRSLEV